MEREPVARNPTRAVPALCAFVTTGIHGSRTVMSVASREFIGVENIMWSSDYPHTVSTWPHSREVVERDFKDVPEKDKRQIVRENAARLYGFSSS